MFCLCKLVFGLILVQQAFADSSTDEGWRQVNFYERDYYLNGAPRFEDYAFELSPNSKNGKPYAINVTSPYKNALYGAQFQYYINVPQNGYMKLVHTEAKTGKVNVIWARYGNTGDVWQTATFALKPEPEDLVQFIGATTSGTLAISYIRFDYPASKLEDNLEFNTGFESNETGWNTQKNVVVGDVFSKLRDHTSNSESGKAAILIYGEITPKLKFPKEARCFTFWFNRPATNFQPSPNPFKVIINGASVWESYDDRDMLSEWIRVQIPLSSTQEVNQFMIKSFNNITTGSAIFFDDFKLSNQPCPGPLDCSFTQDTCGWTHSLQPYDHNWRLGEGRVENIDVYKHGQVPHMKHTIYTDFTRQRPARGIDIKSPFMPKCDDCVLRMNFFYKNVTRGDSFRVDVLEPQSHTGTEYQRASVWMMDVASASKDVQHPEMSERTVDIPLSPSLKLRRLSLYAYSEYGATRIAVKDIKILRKGDISVPTTPSPSKLDKGILMIADELMKNSRANIKRILELITIEDPIKTSLVAILSELEATIQQIERDLQ